MLSVWALPAGCQYEKEKSLERPGGTMGKADTTVTTTTAMQGTVGSVAYPEGGLRLMRVRGYGLVTGLVNKGSRRCPESLRNYIVDAIRRTRMSDPYRRKTGHEPSAGEMLASLDTAVVVVEGEIPAGATSGRPFDVRITAVDEETTSLAGGVLLQTDLKVFHSVSPASVIEGKTLATAGGPIFINPFREATASAPALNLREGTIIAGGRATETRKLSLATSIESYSTVRQIQDAINARFKTQPPTAREPSPCKFRANIAPEKVDSSRWSCTCRSAVPRPRTRRGPRCWPPS
jgi:flagellar basal body P-ring protein FlgI